LSIYINMKMFSFMSKHVLCNSFHSYAAARKFSFLPCFRQYYHALTETCRVRFSCNYSVQQWNFNWLQTCKRQHRGGKFVASLCNMWLWIFIFSLLFLWRRKSALSRSKQIIAQYFHLSHIEVLWTLVGFLGWELRPK
jgi:hypothetical protein